MQRIAAILSLVSIGATATQTLAASFNYNGRLVTCTAACDSIFVLSEGSDPDSADYTRVNFSQPLPIDANLDFTLPGDATANFSLRLRRAFVTTEDPVLGPSDQCPPPNADLQLCNFDSVNPWHLTNEFGTIAGSGTAMTDGTFSSGQVLVTLTQEPYVRNDARFVVDLTTGDAALTLLNGAVTLATFEGDAEFRFDSDGDGVDDVQDNCVLTPNASQYDSNEDGFGNGCDADVNNDCAVNVQDLAIFRANYFSSFPDIDFNGDGIPGVVDLGLLRVLFFKPPGPSALASCDLETSR